LKAPPPPAPVANWTGCYVSAGWGYGFLDDGFSNPAGGASAAHPTTHAAAQGWLGAFGGGCEYQFNGSPLGPLVVGIFGDYDPMDINNVITDPVNDFHHGTLRESDAWFVGARAGILITPTLLSYVSGGWTGAHTDQFNVVNNSNGATGFS